MCPRRGPCLHLFYECCLERLFGLLLYGTSEDLLSDATHEEGMRSEEERKEAKE